jgi:hypothetical protein
MWEVESVESSSTMEVNGDVTEVSVGVDLKELVLETASNAGYGKFRFYIDDEEVMPQDAPSLTEANKSYKITPYDVAG